MVTTTRPTRQSVQFFLSMPGRLALAMFVVAAMAATSLSAAPIRIMALGDSITAGYTDNPVWNVPFEFGYRSGLYTGLTDAGYSFQFVGGSLEPWNNLYGTPQSVGTPDLRTVDQDYHRGYGGWGIDNLTSNVAGWLNTDSPDVILLMIGINNIGQGSSGDPTAAENSLNNLVQTIVQTRPDAHLIVAQITPYASYTDAIVQYNSYIRDTLVPTYAAQGKNVTTVDQYSNFLTGGAIDTSLYSNGINHPNATGYERMAQAWLAGIQALGTITPGDLNARSVLVNGTFESPVCGGNTHNVNIGGTEWDFTPGSVSGAGSGIDRGNLYGSPNCTPSEGSQMAFLQGAGTGGDTMHINQEMQGLIAGRSYVLSFSAKAIAGFTGANPFRVSVDGTDLVFGGDSLVTPVIDDYIRYTSQPFRVTSSTALLSFYDAGGVPFTQVSWIDDVTLAVAAQTGDNLIANGGFETPEFAANSHNVNPGGTGWRFVASAVPGAGSGVERGNPYGVNSTNATPYEGAQMAFLQGLGTGNGVSSIEQDVTGFEVGKSYTLSFEAKAIAGFSGVNPFHVSVDGTDLVFGGDALVTPSTEYARYTSAPFTVTSSTAVLSFYDAGNVPYTYVSWIDDVILTETVVNLVANGGFETPGFGADSHSVDPSGAGWRFVASPIAGAGSGVERGNPYGGNSANTTPFEGDQMAFLQGLGEGNGVSSIEQDVVGFEVGGSYVLSFEAKAIAGFSGANPFRVSIGGTEVTFGEGTIINPTTGYGLYISDPITATDTVMTLRFYDAGGVSYTQVSWIDDVQITAAPVPEPGCVLLLGVGGLVLSIGLRRRFGR